MTDRAGTARSRVLVVDDDGAVRALLTRYLQLEGYDVEEAVDGRSAISAVERQAPDLVLLDRMLPFEDGLDILARLRRMADIPVILLTALGAEKDRVLGLRLGADDYVVKPFSPAEVTARIASVLRRTGTAEPTERQLEFEGLVLDRAARQVIVDGRPVEVTTREFDLLVFLASSPRQVFSRDQILDQVWAPSAQRQHRSTITEHIRRLRGRIERDPGKPRWIKTVQGVGYRFEP